MPSPDETTPPRGFLSAASVVAGYRLVRQVPGETGLESWLAVAAGTEWSPCVLTLCVDDEALARRLAAHERVRSPHVLALLDLATDAEGRILLATERTDWTLATLIASRASIAAGEAVTILAPLTAGLAAVHSAGFSHGRLSPATVLFTADGRPVIGGLDGLSADAVRIHDSGAGARFTAGAVADYRALAGVIRVVADLVDDEARPGCAAIADWLDAALNGDSALDALPAQLECRIFAEAPPLPLILVGDRPPPGVLRTAPASRRRTLPLIGPGRGAAPALAAARMALEGIGHRRMGAWAHRLRHHRTLAVCVGVAVLAVGVSLGLALVPDTTGAGRPATDPPPRAAVQEPPEPPPPARAPHLTAEEETVVTGEDAAAAASALLALRARCAEADAPACVDLFAEQGSAIEAADRHAFAGDGSGVLLADDSLGRVEIVQAYGDAVLTRAVPSDDKRQPVLVLVVRTDTGWRLRDVFEPD